MVSTVTDATFFTVTANVHRAYVNIDVDIHVDTTSVSGENACLVLTMPSHSSTKFDDNIIVTDSDIQPPQRATAVTTESAPSQSTLTITTSIAKLVKPAHGHPFLGGWTKLHELQTLQTVWKKVCGCHVERGASASSP